MRKNNSRKWLNLSPIFLYAAGIPLIVAGWQLNLQSLFLIGLVPAGIASVIVLIQSTAYYQSSRDPGPISASGYLNQIDEISGTDSMISDE